MTNPFSAARFLRAAVMAALSLAPAVAQPFDLPEHRDEARRRALLADMRGWDLESGAPFDVDSQRVCSKERILRSYYDRGLPPGGPGAEAGGGGGGGGGGGAIGDRGPGTDPTDVISNTLDLSVAPPSNAITGANTMVIRSRVDGLSTFTFQLRWNFTVGLCRVTDSVGSYDVTPTVPTSTASPVTYRRTFNLLRPVNSNEIFTVRVEYSGNLQSGIGLGSVFYGRQNGSTSSSVPGVICTLSEPYYAGTWWPCKDADLFTPGDNTDKALVSVNITAPDNMTSASNGMLQGVDALPGNLRRFRWATTYPLATYLVFFSTSVYTEFGATYNHGAGTMPLQFYIYPGSDTPSNRAVWLSTVDMLAKFREIYGLYPFINEKYGIYQFEFSGGMEHQTFTGQGLGGAFSESVTAHEIAHQWWGDDVTCRTWHDIWLNEGSATYGEALWQERKGATLNPAALQSTMLARKPTDANGTVYCFDVTSPGRIFDSRYSYRKAGWVMHMLRRIMGDTAFFGLLQTYRSTFTGSAATTADFTTLASAVAGRDLNWFFNPWLYQPGAPTYQYGWQAATINGQPYLRLMIRQVQTTGPVFTMPVDIDIASSGGTQRATVQNSALLQHFLVPRTSSAAVTDVTLDPDRWILEYGRNAVAYIAGPPKVVDTTPDPGASLPAAAAPSSVSVVFSDGVNIAAPNAAVTRNGSPVPFTLSYAAGTQTATLNFGGPLVPGSYTVAIADSVTASATALALDGEIDSPTNPGAYPTGDGLAGGSLVFAFTVEASACAADFNGVDGLTLQDLFDFLGAYFSGGLTADFNDSGALSVQDIFDFLAAYFAGCD